VKRTTPKIISKVVAITDSDGHAEPIGLIRVRGCWFWYFENWPNKRNTKRADDEFTLNGPFNRDVDAAQDAKDYMCAGPP
jgi:hypothetical protein